MKKCLVLFLLISVSVGHAQSNNKLGFNFGYHSGMGTIGFTYHVIEQFALRPSFTFNITKQEDGSEYYTRELRSTNYGGSLSLLITATSTEECRSYWGGSVAYTFLKEKWSDAYFYPNEQPLSENGNDKGHVTTSGLLIGFQYDVSEKFSLFGEMGIGYS